MKARRVVVEPPISDRMVPKCGMLIATNATSKHISDLTTARFQLKSE